MSSALVKFRTGVIEGVKRSGRGLPAGNAYGNAGMYGGWWGRLFGLLPGAKVNYREMADPAWLNSIVGAAVNWIGRNLPQAPPCVYRLSGDKETIIPGHPLTELLKRPNPYYDGRTLRQATFLSLIAGRGNAYWWIKRSNNGMPLELWYIPHSQCWPVWEQDATTDNWISAYAYRNNGQTYYLKYEDVIHFRDGLDPFNLRSGLDPLGSAYRELVSDNEVSAYNVALLKNMGVVPVIISPKDTQATLIQTDADSLKEQYEEATTGDNRGRPLVLTGGVDVNQIGLSPKDMMPERWAVRSETRITALIGINAVVLGLESGLERSTYSNQEEARRAAWEDGIIPRLEMINSECDTQLLRFYPGASTKRVGADYRRVPVLQENRESQIKYVSLAVGGKAFLLRNEGRDILDLEPIPGWDEEDKQEVALPQQQTQAAIEGMNEPDSDDKTPKNGKNGAKALVEVN